MSAALDAADMYSRSDRALTVLVVGIFQQFPEGPQDPGSEVCAEKVVGEEGSTVG